LSDHLLPEGFTHSKGGADELSGGHANPEADKLLEAGEARVDAAKRAEESRPLGESVRVANKTGTSRT
jgi:hypothetical protein